MSMKCTQDSDLRIVSNLMPFYRYDLHYQFPIRYIIQTITAILKFSTESDLSNLKQNQSFNFIATAIKVYEILT
jgi:hypothetical protein